MAHWWYLITMILWILENFHRDSQDLEIHTVETRASIYSGRRVFDLPFQITIHGLFWIPTLPQGSANRHRKKICTERLRISKNLLVKSMWCFWWWKIMLISMFPISQISHLWFERLKPLFLFRSACVATCQLRVGPGVATFTRPPVCIGHGPGFSRKWEDFLCHKIGKFIE